MPWRSVGITLNEEEFAELDEIAKGLGVSRNQLLRFAVKYMFLDIRDDKLDLRKHLETGYKLKMPE